MSLADLALHFPSEPHALGSGIVPARVQVFRGGSDVAVTESGADVIHGRGPARGTAMLRDPPSRGPPDRVGRPQTLADRQIVNMIPADDRPGTIGDGFSLAVTVPAHKNGIGTRRSPGFRRPRDPGGPDLKPRPETPPRRPRERETIDADEFKLIMGGQTLPDPEIFVDHSTEEDTATSEEDPSSEESPTLSGEDPAPEEDDSGEPS